MRHENLKRRRANAMKKMMALFWTLLLFPTLALASGDMVSISELRQQVEAMGRWTKTYEAYGRTIEVDIPIYIPNEKVVFLGDSIYEELVRDQWIGHSDKLSQLIAELEKLDFTIAVEGHFAPKTKDELLTALREKL